MFKKLLQRLFTRTVELTRSSKNGEKLTDYELFRIRPDNRVIDLLCPDCGTVLAEGPAGGCCQNMACGVCGSEFNITLFFDAITGERISDAGPRDLGDRRQLYFGRTG